MCWSRLGDISLFLQEIAPPHPGWDLSWWRGSSMCSLTLGVKDDLKGIKASVCCCFPAIRRYNTLPGSGRVSLCFTQGNPLTVEQINLCCTSRTLSERFLLQGFSGPQMRGSGICPILDLCTLNKYLRKYKFRMPRHASLLRLMRQNNWFTRVDLKDTYFRIPSYPPHKKYLRFAFQGICYEYRMLPFVCL